MRVAVATELFPSRANPSQGIWALRQAQEAIKQGVDLHVLALRRPLPPLKIARELLSLPPGAKQLKGWLREECATPRLDELDGVKVSRHIFLSPPRPISYGSWGLWATPTLNLALRKLNRNWPVDAVHAHYAAPAGQAVAGWCARNSVPLVVSLHGADILDIAQRSRVGRHAVSSTLKQAQLVLCNSGWTLERAVEIGANDERCRVVHLGSDLPTERPRKRSEPTIVTVADLSQRKRHLDVIEALALLKERLPDLHYLIIGEGPTREELRLAAERLGVADRVEFTGALPHREALERMRSCHLYLMPSVDEAFGVAYIEAMAGWLPAVGCLGEGGPEEIAGCGGGIELVPARDPRTLAERIESILGQPAKLEELSKAARQNAERNFSWEQCGQQTARAYLDVVGNRKEEAPLP